MEKDETTPEGEEQETDATSEELGDAGKRALNQERSARRKAEKELGELRSRLQSIEDEGKSEVEKLRGQVAQLTKDAEAATARADRFEVAAEKGLTPAQARRLVGSTREELEADADAMRSELGLDKSKDDENETEETPAEEEGATTALGRPKEDLHAGASNEGDAEPDAAKLADSILSSPW